jgi:riboflavin kinase/FMN adenylyltransferase
MSMQHVRRLEQLSLDGCGLTIGSFDGVHRGHQELIHTMVRDARAADMPAVVLTFFPHPSVLLRGRKPVFYITSPDEKANLLGELGVDYVITQPFSRKLSQIRAETYLDELEAHLAFRELWIGEDFALGYQREGNRHFLKAASEARGFKLHVVAPYKLGGEVISSTRVREALRSGDVARAATYLGRKFTISGTVVKGIGRGRTLGYPTANIEIWEEKAYPGPGVYACFAEVVGERWAAVTNIGVRPTFEQNHDSPTIEAHLLDFNDELYQREITLTFVDRLRDERRFSNPEALLAQIERDIQRARTMLGKEAGHRDE